ncbi:MULTISPECIES: hypothetical protein [Geobacillus]|nr:MULTISPECIES: hypothetical protein [Geobacillus]YP_008240355.1 hypothetical protein N352_gp51 [Thermus phage phi OH2]AEV17605.1 hypothetical protein GTCCBUS3UF5_2790 [Geobacillus thermoleovorans CCB_US3_UF5]MED4333356.1 hypothetical protein [Geobacillus stearothermophilus]MED4359441.1 hypothetical protein [Geobacillus stearothermophilus]MED4995851.1 hypothetical protein [Geobacillus stearothermophilus]QDY71990.1 hypothetical protein FP515_01520 [Geobacillus thermoleovorans]
MEIKGFDEFKKQLQNMKRAVQELSETRTVPFSELFTQSFMEKYTQFSSFDDFLKAGGFFVETQEDFEAIPDEDMDKHVAKTTKFSDWQTMLDTAVSEYALKKLGF